MVELKLRHLDEVQEAFDLVRVGGSAQGAQLVADYCIDASGQDVLCYVVLCCVVLCCVMLCNVMLCYIMLCYVILFYDMLCYAIYSQILKFSFILLFIQLSLIFSFNFFILVYALLPSFFFLDYKGAIEFLLVANKTEEASKLAQTHSLVDVYCSIIGDQIGNEEALKVAQYYEKSDYGKAGR